MPEEQYVMVATFTFPEEGQLACGRLEAEGIPARLSSDVPSAFYGFSGMGRVELYVPASLADSAAAILAECMRLEEDFDPEMEPLRRKEGAIWVCSLCGDAVSVEDRVCSACGTSREALQPAKSEDLHKNAPARRAAPNELQKDEPAPVTPLLETDFEMPSLDTLHIHEGDILAGWALWWALLSLLFPVLCVIALRQLLKLMLYRGEFSRRGTIKMYIALAIDTVVLLWFAYILIAFQRVFR